MSLTKKCISVNDMDGSWAILWKNQHQDGTAIYSPIVSGLNEETATLLKNGLNQSLHYARLRGFIESLTEALGPYPYVDKTQLVIDARAILAETEGL